MTFCHCEANFWWAKMNKKNASNQAVDGENHLRRWKESPLALSKFRLRFFYWHIFTFSHWFGVIVYTHRLQHRERSSLSPITMDGYRTLAPTSTWPNCHYLRDYFTLTAFIPKIGTAFPHVGRKALCNCAWTFVVVVVFHSKWLARSLSHCLLYSEIGKCVCASMCNVI